MPTSNGRKGEGGEGRAGKGGERKGVRFFFSAGLATLHPVQALKSHLRLIRGSMILDHVRIGFLRGDLYASIYGNFVATLPCKTNTSVDIRVKLWRLCIEKHQTSFLQICGLQTVQISIQLITRSGLSCSVVYTRGKSTPSTN